MCDGLMGRFDFIDCGANIGLFSAQFAVQSYGVEKLTAIEPNRDLFPLAESNLRGARATEVRCLNAALADFEGRGRLVAPEYDSGADSLFLVADTTGEVEVITLSSVLKSRTHANVAIKVDIEGQEVPVLSAAQQEIRSLAKVALFIELHQEVLDRIGGSDLAMMEPIDAIRPWRWVNSDDGAPVDPRRSIFEQIGGGRQCDLIGLSD